jgi:hypothetical protein
VLLRDTNVNHQSIWAPGGGGDYILTYFNDGVVLRNTLGGFLNAQRWRPEGRAIGTNSVGPLYRGSGVKLTKWINCPSGGAAGTGDDVVIWDPTGNPSDGVTWPARFLSATFRCTNGVALSTATLRTAVGGGGSVVLADVDNPTQTFSTATAGRKNDNASSSPLIAVNTGLWLRRSDRSVVGDLEIEYVRNT